MSVMKRPKQWRIWPVCRFVSGAVRQKSMSDRKYVSFVQQIAMFDQRLLNAVRNPRCLTGILQMLIKPWGFCPTSLNVGTDFRVVAADTGIFGPTLAMPGRKSEIPCGIFQMLLRSWKFRSAFINVGTKSAPFDRHSSNDLRNSWILRSIPLMLDGI